MQELVIESLRLDWNFDFFVEISNQKKPTLHARGRSDPEKEKSSYGLFLFSRLAVAIQCVSGVADKRECSSDRSGPSPFGEEQGSREHTFFRRSPLTTKLPG